MSLRPEAMRAAPAERSASMEGLDSGFLFVPGSGVEHPPAVDAHPEFTAILLALSGEYSTVGGKTHIDAVVVG